jgi:hypothetical protein
MSDAVEKAKGTANPTPPTASPPFVKTIRTNKPDLREQSVKTYAAHCKRVAKRNSSGSDFAEGPVLEYLDSLKPGIANQLISALTALLPRFRVHIARYRESAKTHREAQAQKSTPKQRQNWTSVSSIKRAVRLMRREIKQFGFRDERLVMSYFAWAIHLQHAMRNDLTSVRIAETTKDAKPGHNWYVISKGSIFLNVFKTSRGFARRGLLPLKLKLDAKLVRTIAKHVRQRAERTSKYLIVSRTGTKMSKHGFRNLLLSSSQRYLGVKVGSTQLRHIVLSEFLAKNPSLAQRKQMARSMQQLSLETQMMYELRDVGPPKV